MIAAMWFWMTGFVLESYCHDEIGMQHGGLSMLEMAWPSLPATS
jgi:hypothetical protein